MQRKGKWEIKICYNRDLRSRANFTLKKWSNSIGAHEHEKHEKRETRESKEVTSKYTICHCHWKTDDVIGSCRDIGRETKLIRVKSISILAISKILRECSFMTTNNVVTSELLRNQSYKITCANYGTSFTCMSLFLSRIFFLLL